MPEAVGQVADRLAVRDVLSRYAFACDTRNWPLLDSCFAPDAQVHYESLPAFPDGYTGLRASTVRILGSLRSTQHLLGNLHVVVDGDRARSTCYVRRRTSATVGSAS